MADANATLTAEHDAYLGLGVGKFFHRAYAVDREGTELPSRRVANSEAELGGVTAERPADTLAVVDQRRNIGALATRRARARPGGRSPTCPGPPSTSSPRRSPGSPRPARRTPRP